MKKLVLSFLFTAAVSLGLSAQNYHDSIPQTCNPNTGGTEVINHATSYANANGSGTLTVYYTGDGSSSTEYIDLYDEGGALLTTLLFTSQCGPDDIATINLSMTDINTWATDGQITFTYTASSGVNNFCGPSGSSSFCVRSVLDYPYSTAPNDIGVASLDTPSVFCSPNQDVWVTVSNTGINQVDTFSVGWEYNGTPQTSQTFYTLLDTANGVGSNTAQVNLGSLTINDQDTIKAWTFNPNNLSDTVNQNDTVVSIVSPSLGGPYSIGGTSPDYANFTQAVNALMQYGVCAPVTFNVDGSTFNEQISIPAITGASSTNTITFKGMPGSRLEYGSATSTSNYTVQLNGSGYITFDSLTIANTSTTYSVVVDITGSAMNNTFSNNILEGDTMPTSTSTYYSIVYSSTGNDDNNSFLNNTFHGGSYGMYYYGSSTSSLEKGTVIDGNHFKNQYYTGIRVAYQNQVIMANNRISSNSSYTSGYGIYSYYCDSGTVIHDNKLESSSNSGWPYYGMYIYRNDSDPSKPAKVYNNFVQVGDSTYSGTRYGVRAYYTYSMEFYNNNINVLTSGTGYGLYSYYGSGHVYYNNNFVTKNGYAAYFNTTSNVDSSDYNNFYNGGTSPIYYSGVQTLSSYQSASGRDTMSVSYDPMYYGFNDLHTCNNMISDSGTIFGGLTVDIDGDTRPVGYAAIGADESFSPSAGFLGDDIEKCPGDTVTLGPPSAAGTYMWNTGAMTSSITTTNPGTYTLNAQTYCGNSTDTVVVTDLPLNATWGISQQSFLTVVFDGPSGYATYQWYFGDGNSSTQEDPIHIYASPGTYNVTLVASNKCGSDTYIDQVTVSTVGMDELADGASVKVYPNPNKGAFRVNLSNFTDKQADLFVIDMQGKTVYQEHYNINSNDFNQEISLDDVNSGMYYLKVMTESGMSIRKLVIE